MSYNKFNKNQNSKFGSQNINYGAKLSPVMESAFSEAIPIWQFLNITEKQYDILYKTPFIDTSKSITELEKKEE
jgi:hypothetical protein